MSDLNTLSRGLEFLRRIIEVDGEMTLDEIAKEFDLSSSTTHRLMSVLMDQGLISRVGAARYACGWRVASLATHTEHEVLRRIVKPIIKTASQKLKATMHLGVFDGEMVHYLVRSPDASYTSGASFTKEGMELEAYCSAIGKILLSDLSQEAREAYLGDDELIALTDNTITDRDELMNMLDNVRENKIAFDDEEVVPGLRCMAVPVFDAAGRVIAALSVSLDWPEMQARLDDEFIFETLRSSSARISRNIGVA